MASPTWGDTVRVKADALPEMHPGALAAVCGTRKVDTAELARQFNCEIGTTLYLVEYSDGSSLEIPEGLLEPADEHTD